MLKVDCYQFLYFEIGFLLNVYSNQNYFTKFFFIETNFTYGLNYLILRSFFGGIKLIACSTTSIFSFKVFKPLSLCGLYRIIFYEVKSFFLAIPFMCGCFHLVFKLRIVYLFISLKCLHDKNL